MNLGTFLLALSYLAPAVAVILLITALLNLRAARRRYKALLLDSAPAKPVAPIERPLGIEASLNNIVGTTPAPEMAEKIRLWKSGPCIEGSYFATEIAQTMAEINRLTGQTFWPSWQRWEPVPRYEHIPVPGEEKIGETIERHFSVARGFRQTLKPIIDSREITPTAYAIDVAFRLFIPGTNGYQELTPWGQETALKKYIKPSTDFIKENCLVTNEKGIVQSFKDSPEAEEGSIFSVFTVLGAWQRAKPHIQKLLPELWPDYDIGIDAEGLKEAWKTHVSEDRSYWAVRYAKGNAPCLCATYFWLRALTFLAPSEQGVRDEAAIIREALGNKETKLLNFIRACWKEENAWTGGFTWTPGQKATIMHTRFALQILRLLLQHRVIRRGELNWLKPTMTLRFLESCQFDGGFSTYREPTRAPIPTLSATRAALNTLKLLEIFRLNGIFGIYGNEAEYGRTLQRLLGGFNNIMDFVASCYEEDTDSYWMFPPSYLEQYAAQGSSSKPRMT